MGDLSKTHGEGSVADEQDPLIGTVAAGRYKILRRLGEGGMGAVYEVEHQLIGRRFALKTLHPEYARHREAVARFQREARAAAAIGDPHIIEVSDMGTLDDGSPFIVLEMLEGQDLGKLLEQTGPMTLVRSMAIVKQACTALAKAHEKGIVHRDIKPDNIFILQRNGQDFVKLVDFGISKVQESAIGLAATALTKTGAAMGTPYYMAPEQIMGDPSIDARADVYAMGVVVFQMLTGGVPFEAPTVPALMVKVLQEAPPSIRMTRPDLPRELEAAINKALAKKPDERFATIDELALVLASFELMPSLPPKQGLPPPGALAASLKQSFDGATTGGSALGKGGALFLWAAVFLTMALAVFAGVRLATSAGGSSASVSAERVPPQPRPPPSLPTRAPAALAPAHAQASAIAPEVKAPALEAKHEDATQAVEVRAPADLANGASRSGGRRRRATTSNQHATPGPVGPVATPQRSVVIENQRRAGVSLTIKCGGAALEVEVAALGKSSASVPATQCTVSCRGVGNPHCPMTLREDARFLEVK